MIWLMKVGVGGPVSGPELAKNLISLGQAVDLILLEFARVAAEFAKTDEYDQQGFDSPISWLKENCHMSGGAAEEIVFKERLQSALGERGDGSSLEIPQVAQGRSGDVVPDELRLGGWTGRAGTVKAVVLSVCAVGIQ